MGVKMPIPHFERTDDDDDLCSKFFSLLQGSWILFSREGDDDDDEASHLTWNRLENSISIFEKRPMKNGKVLKTNNMKIPYTLAS